MAVYINQINKRRAAEEAAIAEINEKTGKRLGLLGSKRVVPQNDESALRQVLEALGITDYDMIYPHPGIYHIALSAVYSGNRPPVRVSCGSRHGDEYGIDYIVFITVKGGEVYPVPVYVYQLVNELYVPFVVLVERFFMHRGIAVGAAVKIHRIL